jgi:hypothetical protein
VSWRAFQHNVTIGVNIYFKRPVDKRNNIVFKYSHTTRRGRRQGDEDASKSQVAIAGPQALAEVSH